MVCKEDLRRSDRVSLELPIQVSGTDLTGREFCDRGRTIVVTRHGGKIQLSEKLVPDQEIIVGSLETKCEAPARIVGILGDAKGGYLYGIVFLDEDADVWGIEFAARTEGEDAVGRTVPECSRRHAREVTYLDGIELEVLEVNCCITRQCKRCTDTSIWKKSFGEAPPAAIEVREKRRESRRKLRVKACVRRTEFGEDVVTRRDVSPSDLCFEGPTQYHAEQEIEIALPYTSKGGNIFLGARIVHIAHDVRTGLIISGAQYRR